MQEAETQRPFVLVGVAFAIYGITLIVYGAALGIATALLIAFA